jgi:hypothetical protein
MSERWKSAMQIWPFKDAPEELRRLSPWQDGTEELLLFVPPELDILLESGAWAIALPAALWFLSKSPKRDGHLPYAGDGFGWYLRRSLPRGGRVAITTESERNHPCL